MLFSFLFILRIGISVMRGFLFPILLFSPVIAEKFPLDEK
jgi:hypothetical protein